MNEEQLYQQFFNNFKLGLKRENNNQYTGVNKSSGAIGKYQFVPQFWINPPKDKSPNIMTIPEFAKKNKYGNNVTAKDFENSASLQEAYFEYYTKNYVWPATKKLYKEFGLKRNISIDSIGAMVHFQGEGNDKKGTRAILTSGEHKGETKINPSSLEYLVRFNNSLSESGLKNIPNAITNSVFIGKEQARKAYTQMQNERKAVMNDRNLSPDVKNLKSQEISKKYFDQGYYDVDDSGKPIGAFNDIINEDKAKGIGANQREKNITNYFNSALVSNITVDPDDKGKNKTRFSEFDELDLSPKNIKGSKEENFKVLLKDNPELYKYLTWEGERYGKDGKGSPYTEVARGVSKRIKNEKELNAFLASTKDKTFSGNWSDKLSLKIPNSKDNPFLQKVNKAIQVTTNNKDFNLFAPNGKINDDNFTKRANQIGEDGYFRQTHLLEIGDITEQANEPIVPLTAWKEEQANGGMGTSNVGDVPGAGGKSGYSVSGSTTYNPGFTPEKYKYDVPKHVPFKQEHPTPETPTVKADPIKDDLSVFNAFWGNEPKEPVTDTYNPENYKDSFPFADVLGNAAMLLEGNKLANTKLPMRDEQISDAFRNYGAELAKLSQIGLRPEEEAYAKRMLSESYQSGLEQIVKASGGNRNVVLGNLGRLDYQKQKGLLEISMADVKAKNEALHKYGEAMKYINEFDSNRDIANNERKYDNALMDRQVGGQLMAAGFKDLLDNIDYYKNNKPGSVNHAMKSHWFKQTMGVDPSLKDDGSGRDKYTMSWRKLENEKIQSDYFEDASAYEMAQTLNDEQKKIVQDVLIQSNGSRVAANKITKYLYENKNVSGFDKSKLSEALKTNDYSVLFKNKTNEQRTADGSVLQGTILNATTEPTQASSFYENPNNKTFANSFGQPPYTTMTAEDNEKRIALQKTQPSVSSDAPVISESKTPNNFHNLMEEINFKKEQSFSTEIDGQKKSDNGGTYDKSVQSLFGGPATANLQTPEGQTVNPNQIPDSTSEKRFMGGMQPLHVNRYTGTPTSEDMIKKTSEIFGSDIMKKLEEQKWGKKTQEENLENMINQSK